MIPDFGTPLVRLIQILIVPAIVGVVALLAGAIYGAVWMVNHVRFQ